MRFTDVDNVARHYRRLSDDRWGLAAQTELIWGG